jgi:DNA recombination protein RmuC
MDMIIIIAVTILGFIIVAFLVKHWLKELSENSKPTDELMEWLKSTNSRLDSQSKTLNERLDNAARYISQVQKSIGEMSEIGRGMKELQEFLRSPKLRGNMGEQVLKELLTQMLPKQSFKLQYAFTGGQIVDAVIVTSQGIIPIDSKFPLENFRRMINSKDDGERKNATKDFTTDVKKHIDDISRKYILPQEGTIDYALLYVPSEAVYYEVVNDQSLFEYATNKRVLPVSPMTFYAYLRTILMSFEGNEIAKEAKAMVQLIRAIQKDYEKVEETLGVLGKHVKNAYNTMNDVTGAFNTLGQKLSQTKHLPEKDTQQLVL